MRQVYALSRSFMTAVFRLVTFEAGDWNKSAVGAAQLEHCRLLMTSKHPRNSKIFIAKFVKFLVTSDCFEVKRAQTWNSFILLRCALAKSSFARNV